RTWRPPRACIARPRSSGSARSCRCGGTRSGPDRPSELEVAVLAEEDPAPDVQAVAAAAWASATRAGDRAVDRGGGLAGLIPRGRAFRGTGELDREQLERFVAAQEPVGMRGRAPDDQAGAERHRALRHERLPAASQHDHPLLGVGMRVRVGDLVGREPLDRQVVVRALADRPPPEPRGTERDEVLGQHPEHPEVVQDLREVADVVLGRLARTQLGRHARSLPLRGVACIAVPVGRGLSSRRPSPGRIREGTMTTELLIVGGDRVPAAEEGTFTVIEPGNGAPMAEVAEAGPEDARRAVDVAVRAFEEGQGRGTRAPARGRVLLRASTLVREGLEDLSRLEARNGGKPIGDARDEIGIVANTLEYWGGAA